MKNRQKRLTKKELYKELEKLKEENEKTKERYELTLVLLSQNETITFLEKRVREVKKNIITSLINY